jgi:hypothetical protein
MASKSSIFNDDGFETSRPQVGYHPLSTPNGGDKERGMTTMATQERTTGLKTLPGDKARGAATCSLASYLALAPIHERGTPAQKSYYMKRCAPPQPVHQLSSAHDPSFDLKVPACENN